MIKKSTAIKKINRKLLYGIAINDANYTVNPRVNGKRVMCPYYQIWKHMLTRCYNDNFHTKNPTYKNCTVSNDWLIFSKFKEWMKLQNWKGNQLDKDILFPGNKHYSQETCIFVTREINLLLNSNKGRRGRYPQGVCFDKKFNKLRVQCSVSGKLIFLGHFDDLIEAENKYNEFKANHILYIANKQTDKRIKSGLLSHAKKIKENSKKRVV